MVSNKDTVAVSVKGVYKNDDVVFSAVLSPGRPLFWTLARRYMREVWGQALVSVSSGFSPSPAVCPTATVEGQSGK